MVAWDTRDMHTEDRQRRTRARQPLHLNPLAAIVLVVATVAGAWYGLIVVGEWLWRLAQ